MNSSVKSCVSFPKLHRPGMWRSSCGSPVLQSLLFPPWDLCSFAARVRWIGETNPGWSLWDLCLHFRASVCVWGWIRRIFSYVLIYSRTHFQGVCGRYWWFEIFWSKSVLSCMFQWDFIGGFFLSFFCFHQKLENFLFGYAGKAEGNILRHQWGVSLPSFSCLSKCPCPNCASCDKLLYRHL